MNNDNIIWRTFKYRLYPNKTQEQLLFQTLDVCRSFYNMALAERIYQYTEHGYTSTKKDLRELFKNYRRVFPNGHLLNYEIADSVILQLEKAYNNFFRRVKQGDGKAGFPKFKGWQYFNSFEIPRYAKGVKITDDGKLYILRIGNIRVRWDKRGQPDGKIKTTRIIHKNQRWYVAFSCEVPRPDPLPKTGNIAGVDVGISSLVTTSDGDCIPNPNYYREGQAKLRRLQRKLARAKKGSNNRKKVLLQVQRQQEHVANQRKDYLHKLSRWLIDNYDAIAFEDLKITNMVKNKHLSKSILDSGWGMLTEMMSYKADEAGRDVFYVDPAYTSKTCSNCGQVFEGLTLADRWVTCDCGLSMDRDHNAAVNILRRAMGDF